MSPAPVPEPVQAAWERAVAAWDEPAAHDAVMTAVAASGCYAWAAGQYRGRAGDPVADRQLARIQKAAVATMYASATQRDAKEPKPYRATTSVLLMLIVAIIAGLFYATFVGDHLPKSSAPPLPAAPAPAVR